LGAASWLSAGGELYLVALSLSPLAVQGQINAGFLLLMAGCASIVLAIGALRMARLVIEIRSVDEPSLQAGLFNNGIETLLAAAANLILLAARFLMVAGIAWLAWFLMAESLSWWGGDKVSWIRWGLDGSLIPPEPQGLRWVARAIAGILFLAVFGLVLA